MSVDLPDYEGAQIIRGIYNGTYTTVAVDEDGNIIGVFKGDYDGALKTLKTDSSGRLLAIITDPEDVYGNIHMVGNAELAARLGSIDTFERQGTVFHMDNMEHTLGNWVIGIDGAGGAVTRSTQSYLSGTSSCKILTGAVGGNYANITKRLPYPVISRNGMEANVALVGDDFLFDMMIDYSTGTALKRYGIRFDEPDSELQIHTPEDSYETFETNIDLIRTEKAFNFIKLVIDAVNEKYVRLIINETTYDLSAYAPETIVTGISKSIYTHFTLVTAAAASKTCYIDNVIITTNEP